MPAATQTVPSWMTGGASKDIPLSGISNGFKSKNTIFKQQVSSAQNDVPDLGDTLPVPPATDEGFTDQPPPKSAERQTYETDKAGFVNAWTNAGNAVGTVFDDLFRELSGVSSDQINQLVILVNTLSVKIGVDDYNTGVRSWNASIPDRKSLLKPLRNPSGQDIFGLQVTIEDLEAYPDVIKAALLIALGFRPEVNTFSFLFDDTENLIDDRAKGVEQFITTAGLLKPWNARSDEENDAIATVKRDQAKDGKSGRDQLEARLTKQLRVAVGLPAVSVG